MKEVFKLLVLKQRTIRYDIKILKLCESKFLPEAI